MVIINPVSYTHLDVYKRQVYTWGDGSYYDLGHGNMTNLSYPKKVEKLPKIKMVAKGENHTLALDVDGNVWGWGNNSNYECGSNNRNENFYPTKISGIDDVKYIAAGEGFSAVIKNDGSVWTLSLIHIYTIGFKETWND